MEFEQLLRKYLDGSMSEGELDTFRALLDRVPEYRMELRQTLEIRSLLHDDALTLKAPADLSEHIRIAVGSSFAADAIVDQQRDHRKPFWPLAARISAGVLVAACFVVGVALTPTLPPLARQILRGESVGTQAQASEPGSVSAVRHDQMPAASAGLGRHLVAVPRSLANADIASAIPERTSRFVNNLQMLGHEFPSRNITPANGSDASSHNVADNNAGHSPSVTRVPESLLAHDHPNLFNQGIGGSAYAALPDPSFRSPMAPLEGSLSQAITGADGRSLTFGITLGSGQAKSPTALLQNSYYFAFAVSGSDRVGVEMGASSFQQVKTVTPGNAAPLGKGTAGAVSDDAPSVGAGNRSAVHSQSLETDSQQPITYGAVFYDRRLKLSHSWDLCGRVTVGGADDAMIGNMRAYAAYTIPTTKSVTFTFTMGVGGGTLYSLTPHKDKPSVSGNYGIFYGIETGF